jgi:hypothetical protein
MAGIWTGEGKRAAMLRKDEDGAVRVGLGDRFGRNKKEDPALTGEVC